VRNRNFRTVAFAGVLAAVAISATGCGGDDAEPAAAGSSQTPAASPSMAGGAAAPGGEFGPACSAVPADGAGSFSGMAQDPVATAASNNPVLSTLVTAVTKAGLVDTLNSQDAITVFAPTNDAFAKLPKATLDKVLADKATLTKILTYHVVPGKQAPDALDSGSFTTLQGGKVTTTKTGENYQVNEANVVCGNVTTRNATVYLVDSVLMPA
jgi:uncharacterized surface protein with fasciclin (FAS1) repeats